MWINRRQIFYSPDGDGSSGGDSGNEEGQLSSNAGIYIPPLDANPSPVFQVNTPPTILTTTAPTTTTVQHPALNMPQVTANTTPPQVVINMPPPLAPPPVPPLQPVPPTPPSISEENLRDFTKRLETMEGNMPTGMTDDALKAFNKRLEKMDGNAQGFAMMLFHENYQLRDRVRSLETKVSPDGALVLTGDDAQAWQAYQQLGAPEKVKQGLDRVLQLQGELENQRREALLRKVADVAHFRYQILVDRDKAARADGRSLEYLIRDEDVNGIRTPVAYIKEGETELAITDFAREQWGDYLAVLQADNQGASSPVVIPQGAPPTIAGTRFINQTGASGSNGGGRGPDLVARFQAEQEAAAKEVKNPLLRGS